MSLSTPARLARPVSGARSRRTFPVRVGLCWGVLLLTASAPALGASQRVAVTPFQGPGAEELRAAMVARISPRVMVLPARQTQRAVGSPGSRSPAAWAAVARRLNAAALVDGRISTANGWRVQLVVRRGKTGAAAGTLVWTGRQPRQVMSDVLREAPARVLALVGQAGRPAARRAADQGMLQDQPEADESRLAQHADDEPAATLADEPDGPSSRAAASRQRGVLLEAAFGPRILSRALTFTDNVSGAPGYTLPIATAVGAELSVFPGARAGGMLSNLGLAAAWETSLAARTAGRDGQESHATRHVAYRAGARARLPLSRASLLAGIDYGQQRFELDLVDATLSPGVRYRFLRPTLAGRVPLDDFAVSLAAGYLHLLSVGGLGESGAFPRATVRGFEASAGLAYQVAADLEVDLTVELRRFAYAMNARPGDRFVAGGAVDDYFGAAVRFIYRVQ